MLPAKPFYLIRHGQSTANARHITAGGQFDAKLTAKGVAQAAELGPYLDQLEIKPGHIYHSTMIRATDTAKNLNVKLQLPMTPDINLREHDMGIWDGLPWTEVEPLLQARETPPGGESESVFAQRIQVALTEILDRPADAPPMIVAHGGLFHAIGFLYEYGMSEVQNCHLHYFEPYQDSVAFPWRMFVFDPVDGTLVKRPAPYGLQVASEANAL